MGSQLPPSDKANLLWLARRFTLANWAVTISHFLSGPAAMFCKFSTGVACVIYTHMVCGVLKVFKDCDLVQHEGYGSEEMHHAMAMWRLATFSATLAKSLL